MQKKQITEAEALRKLGDLCARGEHCSGEMVEKLRIIDKLIDYKYIDDERFTRSFVRDKIVFNKWGRRKIEQTLWQKHIPQSISQPILDEIEPQEYLNVLRPLLKSKYLTIKAETDYERSMKLIKYAMGRGFTLDIIRLCIDDVTIVDDIDDNDED